MFQITSKILTTLLWSFIYSPNFMKIHPSLFEVSR